MTSFAIDNIIAHEMIGRTLSHYRVVEEIGRGGMGIVYRAPNGRIRNLVNSLADGNERRLTQFRGKLGYLALASDGESLYFTCEQNSGDIWVADVIYE